MICITGQNTGNGGDPKPFANACHRRCTPPKTSWKIRSNKRTWQQCKKRQLPLDEWCSEWKKHAAILFPANALHSQGVRGKHVTVRTITKDPTSFFETFWPFWLLMGAPKVLVSTFQLVGIFTPRKRVGFGRDSFLPFQSFMEPAHHP